MGDDLDHDDDNYKWMNLSDIDPFVVSIERKKMTGFSPMDLPMK
jgi:hypothetical protein